MPDCLPILLAQSSSVPLQWLDVLVLAASVVGVTAFGMWIGRKEESTTDYYLAGKTVAWWAVAGSIFGTNISSHHMVGMMGAGLKEGFAQANFEFGAIFGLLDAVLFLPALLSPHGAVHAVGVSRPPIRRSQPVGLFGHQHGVPVDPDGRDDDPGSADRGHAHGRFAVRDQLRNGRVHAGRRGHGVYACMAD